MKEINGQLYGYSYELNTTSESDGTKCFAVDTGTVFVAYKGVWYEQPGSFWAASISEGEDDLYKTSWEINKIVPADDLLIINAVDTGKRYISFNGAWYAEPVQWSAPAAGGGGGSDLPDPTEANEGDVLTVDDGAWVAAPSGGSGVLVLHSTYDESLDTYVLDKTAFEIYSASLEGKVVVIAPDSETMLFTTSYLSLITVNPETDASAFRFMDISPVGQIGVTMYTAGTRDDYPRLNS